MFRVVLALCLITTTLLGPVMCCCAATPLHPQESASATVSTKRSCCAKSEQAPPVEHQKTPKHDDCPCNKNKPTQAVRVDAVSTVPLDQLLTTFSEALAVECHLTPLIPVAVPPHAAQPYFFLTAEQFLDAHHRLRC